MKCPSCSTELADNAKFCPECGEKIVRKTVCPDCGTEAAPGAKFCAECGHKFVSAPAPASASGKDVPSGAGEKAAGQEDNGAIFIETSDARIPLLNAGEPTDISLVGDASYFWRDGGYYWTIKMQLKNKSAHDAAALDVELVFFREEDGEIVSEYSVAHTIIPGRKPRAGETTETLVFKDLKLDENPPDGKYQVGLVISEIYKLYESGGYDFIRVASGTFDQLQDWKHYEEGTVIETDGYMARTNYSSCIDIDGCAMSVSRESKTINVVIRTLTNQSHWKSGSLRACLLQCSKPPEEGDNLVNGFELWTQDLVKDSLEPGESVSDLSASGTIPPLTRGMDFYPVLAIEERNADGAWYQVATKGFPLVNAMEGRRNRFKTP